LLLGNALAASIIEVDSSGESLAYCHHRRIAEPARTTAAGFFFIATSPIGRRRATSGRHTSLRASSDSAPSSELLQNNDWPARANVPAGGAPCARSRPLCSQGIGFAPEMIEFSPIMPRNQNRRGISIDDRLSDLARAGGSGRDCRVGEIRMNKNIRSSE
jgi:hypothetical protein